MTCLGENVFRKLWDGLPISTVHWLQWSLDYSEVLRRCCCLRPFSLWRHGGIQGLRSLEEDWANQQLQAHLDCVLWSMIIGSWNHNYWQINHWQDIFVSILNTYYLNRQYLFITTRGLTSSKLGSKFSQSCQESGTSSLVLSGFMGSQVVGYFKVKMLAIETI